MTKQDPFDTANIVSIKDFGMKCFFSLEEKNLAIMKKKKTLSSMRLEISKFDSIGIIIAENVILDRIYLKIP